MILKKKTVRYGFKGEEYPETEFPRYKSGGSVPVQGIFAYLNPLEKTP